MYLAHPKNSFELEPPADGPAFEDLCLVIYNAILHAEAAMFYGRSGQKQHGVDLVFYLAGNRRVFVQCKNEANLPVTKVKDALNAFNAKWGTSLKSGDKFILAVRQDDVAINDAIDEFRHANQVAYSIEVDSLRTLSAKARDDDTIWNYFCKHDRDTQPGEDVRSLALNVEGAVAQGNLKLALAHFNTKRGVIEKDAELKHPKLLRAMVELYLAGGEFHEAYRLLNHELGLKQYSARVWCEYLRATRFTTRF